MNDSTGPAPRKVAFLGLGVMGYHMAGHLAKAGHDVAVYNRTGSKAARWADEFDGRRAATRRTPRRETRSCSRASAMTTTFAR